MQVCRALHATGFSFYQVVLGRPSLLAPVSGNLVWSKHSHSPTDQGSSSSVLPLGLPSVLVLLTNPNPTAASELGTGSAVVLPEMATTQGGFPNPREGPPKYSLAVQMPAPQQQIRLSEAHVSDPSMASIGSLLAQAPRRAHLGRVSSNLWQMQE